MKTIAPEPLILAIDQGTQSTRALVFDASGNVIAQTTRSVSVNTLDALRVEQDADEIAASCAQAITAALNSIGTARVSRAGLATQRSSVAVWDAVECAPLAPVLSWRDRRAGDFVRQLSPVAEAIKQRSGLKLTPHYGATKLRWLLLNNPVVAQAAQDGSLHAGPLASFLIQRLVERHPYLVDQANAARMQLLNLLSGEWDPWLVRRFGLTQIALPRVCPIEHPYGRLSGSGIRLTAVSGDQNAAIYAYGPVATGTVLVNLGTGAFLLAPTAGMLSHRDLLTSTCGGGAGRTDYMLEGTVNGAGAALAWAADQLGLARPVAEALDQWLEQPPSGVFINTIGGLGSPFWRDGPPAHWRDLAGRPVTLPAGEAIAAVAESIVFLLRINLGCMQTAGLSPQLLRISGGLARSARMCQLLADGCELPVTRPLMPEASARGIAWLAGGRPPGWDAPRDSAAFTPRTVPDLARRFRTFRRLLDQSL